MTRRAAFLLLALALLPAAAGAQEKTGLPSFRKLRFEEDYAYLRDPSLRRGPLDRLKFIPLSKDGDIFLSLGGEARERYEFTDDPAWGHHPLADLRVGDQPAPGPHRHLHPFLPGRLHPRDGPRRGHRLP